MNREKKYNKWQLDKLVKRVENFDLTDLSPENISDYHNINWKIELLRQKIKQ